MNNSRMWLLLIGLLLVAFSNVKADSDSGAPELIKCFYRGADCNESDIPEDANTIKIATGQIEGTYFPVGAKLARAASENLKDRYIMVYETSGSIHNLDEVSNGRYDFGIVQSDVLYFKDPNSRIPGLKSRVKVVGAIYREPVYILVRNKLHLTGIEELQGKKIAIGLTDSGTKYTSEIILGMFGISLDEIEPSEPNYVQIANLFKKEEKEETIDAAIIVNARIPDQIEPLVIDETTYCLKLRKSDLTQIASARPYLYRLVDVNDPGHDPNRPEKTNKNFRTISVTCLLVTRPKSPYSIVRTFTEQLCKYIVDREKSILDPNVTDLLVDYPFLLYGKKSDVWLYHQAARVCYNKKANLQNHYKFNRVRPYIFPVCSLIVLFFILLGPMAFKWPKSIGFDKWPKWIRNRTSLCTIAMFYSIVIMLSYIGLCCFELGIENPDITGRTPDLFKVLLLYFKLGEVACITPKGEFVRDLTVLVGAIFGIGMLGRLGYTSAENKIREVLKMFPKNSYDHIIICNWTGESQGLIAQLRSDALRKKKRIVVIAQPDDSQESSIESRIAKYRDVYIFPGDPADVETFRNKDLNIWGAKAVLILADDRVLEEDPDIRSRKILTTIKSLLKDSQDRPDIIVELSKSNPAVEEDMKKHGADKVISYADMKHKLLAQAIITPRAINFVREILTAEKASNEVYELSIPSKIVQDIINDCKKSGRPFTFRSFAHEIAIKYSLKYNNSITVVGISTKAGIYINPKDRQFSDICKSGIIETAIVLSWKEPREL